MNALRRFSKRHLLIAMVVTMLLVMVPSSSQADNTLVKAGSKPVSLTQKWGVPTFYGIDMNFKFCWSTGGESSRIRRVEGSADCWANFVNQVQNCKGPANGMKTPIRIESVSSRNYANIYFWFQSRSCATGNFNVGCSKWFWHKIQIRVDHGGGYKVVDRY